MKKFLLITLTVSFFSNAQAQNQNRQKNRVLTQIDQLYSSVDRSRLEPVQLRQIQDLLFQAEEIVYGSRRPPRVNYICVSRDNDGRDPYSLAIQNADRSVQKLSLTYSSIELCERAIRSGRYVSGKYFICSSRDNDGRNPWSIYSLSSSKAQKHSMVFSGFETCEQALKDGLDEQEYFFVCSSRDSDGRSPWSLYRYQKTVNGSFVRVDGQTYNSYEDCQRNQLRR